MDPIKRLFTLILFLPLLLLSACSPLSQKTDLPSTQADPSSVTGTLVLDGRRYTYSGNASDISVTEDCLTIVTPGSYRVSGALTEGCIRVDVGWSGTVRLILDGVSITSSHTSPLQASSAACVILELANGSVNTLTDAKRTVAADSESLPACIDAKCDLILTGMGSLAVSGRAQYAISCDSNLVVESGSLTLSSPEIGIRVRDRFLLMGGSVTVTTAKTGIAADAAVGALGSAEILGGHLTASCSERILSAGKTITVTGGTASLKAPNLYHAPTILITAPGFPQ